MFPQDLLAADYGHKKSVFSLATMIIALLLVLSSNAFAVDEWAKDEPLGSQSPSDIDTLIGTNNEAQDRFLAYGRFQMKMTYSSASQLTVGEGSIICSNSTGTVRRMRLNTSSTTVSFSEIDTGSEASSTTYYVYCIADTDVANATFKISLSASAPTGVTYYKRIGSFYNDASSNITNIVNDNASAGQVYDSGWFAVSNSTDYVKTHNLGTTKVLVFLFGATDSDGSNAGTFRQADEVSGSWYGMQLYGISTTTIGVHTDIIGASAVGLWNGSDHNSACSYARVIVIALEN